MQGQGRQPLLAADDLGDLHQVVVHDVGEVVGREFVGPLPEDLVVQRGGVDLDVAADQVVHLHDAPFGHQEADGPVGALRQQALHLLFGEGQRVAQGPAGEVVVDEGLAAGFGLGAAFSSSSAVSKA